MNAYSYKWVDGQPVKVPVERHFKPKMQLVEARDEIERARRLAKKAKALEPSPMPEPKKLELTPEWRDAIDAMLFRAVERYRVIDCHVVDEVEADMTPRRPVKQIIESVARQFGVTYGEIVGGRRQRRLIEPRHFAMFKVWTDRPDLSLPMIGKMFGGRDHTTVLHAVRKHGGFGRNRGG